MEQTLRFDPRLCTSPTLVSAHTTACQGSRDCVDRLQTFCTQQIHTTPEFTLHNAVVQCHVQCGADPVCRKQCASTPTQTTAE